MTKKNKKPKKNRITFEIQQHGSQYQMKLLLLFLWRGIKDGCKFKLGTEIKAAEKFDDLVFYHKNVGEERYRVRYLQAKNSMHDNSLLKYDDFITTQYKARCNLKKYFTSFQKIKQKVIGGDIQDYIIGTNIALPELVLRNADGDSLEFQEVTKMDNFFTSSDPCKWKRYKLIEQSALSNPKLKEIFENSTNLGLLAEELSNAIYKPKNDEDDKNDDGDNTMEVDQNIEKESDNKKVNLD
uniref:Uncharacterized protein n=1 Tax=Panagrolaimus sp. PS1159 TaxID=55785 RepID=A0AC35F8K5_9BILA